MHITMPLIYLLGGIYAGGALILITEIIMLAMLYRHYRHRIHHFSAKEETIYQHALDITATAREQAATIVTSATQKAEEIIHDTQAYKAKLQDKVGEQLEKAATDHIALFNTSMGNLVAAFRDELGQVKTDFISESAKHLDELKAKREAQMQELDASFEGVADFSKQYLQDRLEQEIAKVTQELKSYQTTKMEKIDYEVMSIVKQVLTQVLPKGLTIQNQDQLTLHALEQAKQDGMFIKD